MSTNQSLLHLPHRHRLPQDQIEYLKYVIEHCQMLIQQIQAQIDAGETFDS